MADVCDKHDKVMERLFDDINQIKIMNSEIKGIVVINKDFRESLHQTIYGNGREGLLSKVTGILRQITLQWSLLMMVFGALIVYFFKK